MAEVNAKTVRLVKGEGDGTHGVCAMQVFSLLVGEQERGTFGGPTVHPECVSRELSVAVQITNDGLPDSERHRILPLLPRLAGLPDGGKALGEAVGNRMGFDDLGWHDMVTKSLEERVEIARKGLAALDDLLPPAPSVDDLNWTALEEIEQEVANV